MKLVALAFIAVSTAVAVEPGNCGRTFTAQFSHGGTLDLDIRSGDIKITGSDQDAVSIECGVGQEGRPDDIRIDFDRQGNKGRLRVHGGPNSDVRIRIRVPKELNMVLRCPAGDVDIEGIRGSKDISLRAGDLTVQVGNPRDYATAEASVKAGDIDARAFGRQTGGLFRSFQHKNPGGKYHLKASLWAGDLKFH
ncbi:MAG TPA: hypothetical protein VES20_05330 [Bryobacteraceae bacterium]|nr:hypothetical protein [Bryobacteraceae bacterium]